MKFLKLSVALLFAPFFCMAWNDSGHMTAGAVAYYYLKQHDPAVLQKVLTSFQSHPWYKAEWATKTAGLTDEQKNIALFMMASTWPDEIRKNDEYGGPERAKWHYINYPVVPKGEKITLPALPTPNAEEKLTALINSLKQQPDSKEKAVDLCWLFHITEDVHMPLHTVALFDQAHPNGDKGGNDTYIKLPDAAKNTRLHSYWDGLVPGTFATIPAKAEALLADPKYSKSKLKEQKSGNVNDWIKKEGVKLATSTVYQKGKISGTEANPTAVDATYVDNAKALGEKRVVLSGIRLAKKLIEIYS